MNRHYRLIVYVVLAVVVMVSISQSGKVAQGLYAPDDGDPSPQATEGTTTLVSSSFTYQGQLKNGGAAVNRQCDFIWDIFADPSGGISLATDTDTAVQVTNGLFTVVINLPVTVMDGNARYVEIQVRCPAGTGGYTTLTPRQQLQAAPYALGLRLPFAHTINNNTTPLFAVTNTGGTTTSPSILGSSLGGDGVQGKSTGAGLADNGVYGETNSTASSDAAVKGVSTDSAAGGYFTSKGNYGVYGTTDLPGGYGGYFNNSGATTTGAALYANGDAKQSLTSDGFVKAGVYVYCAFADSLIHRSFNNVNTATITVTNGVSNGRCTVDFGFDVTDRFVSALAWDNGARIVTFRTSTTNNLLEFFRYDAVGNSMDGAIMIMIY